MTDLFEAPTTTTETPDPNKNYFEELVGEGKKFKSPEDLARGKAESDRFIQQLQSELAGLRQELNTRTTLEELMTKINSREPSQNTPVVTNQTTYTEGGETKQQLSLEDIDKLLEERMSKAEKQRVQTQNLETVRQALVQNWGQDYVTHLKAKAQELGVGEDFLGNLAREQPKAFLKLVEAEPKATASPQNSLFTPPTGQNVATQRPQGFAPTGEKLKSWYDNLKRTNPSEYWSPSTQNQMHKDAIRLGEKFFDTPL